MLISVLSSVMAEVDRLLCDVMFCYIAAAGAVSSDADGCAAV